MDVEMLYLNGSFLPLSEGRVRVEDRGFELGDGVYEVVKVMNRRLVWLDDHLQRLGRSLDAITLTDAIAAHKLDEVLPELVARSGVEHGWVYLQVTRGVAGREFEFPASPHPTVLAYARVNPALAVAKILGGTVLHPVEDIRWARCDIKSTNLLAAVLAKEEARSAGAHEALFVAPEGTVREGGLVQRVRRGGGGPANASAQQPYPGRHHPSAHSAYGPGGGLQGGGEDLQSGRGYLFGRRRV